MKVVSDAAYGANMLYAEFAAGERTPIVELTSRFQTQDRALDWSKKIAADEDPAVLRMWTKYPQSETAEGRRDSLDPDTFKYTITTREIRA